MKTLVLASLLGALTLSVSAQPVIGGNTDSNTVTITAKGPVIVLPARPHAMSRDEFARFTGSYELSNGDSIALFTRGLKKYGALHGEAWHELVAVSGNTFVAKDRQLKVSLAQDENGEVYAGEVVFVTPADSLAKANSRRQRMQSVAMR